MRGDSRNDFDFEKRDLHDLRITTTLYHIRFRDYEFFRRWVAITVRGLSSGDLGQAVNGCALFLSLFLGLSRYFSVASNQSSAGNGPCLRMDNIWVFVHICHVCGLVLVFLGWDFRAPNRL